MKTSPTQNKFWHCALIALVFGASAARADEKAAAQAKAGAVAPRSMFVDDARSGKDPFFPNSIRRVELPVQTSPPSSAPQPNLLLNLLALKGISGTKDHPLALINNSTIAAGEWGDVRVSGAKIVIVKVFCREIRERSVLVEIAGISEVRELKLRDGI